MVVNSSSTQVGGNDRMLFKDGGGPMRKKKGGIHPEAILMIVLKMTILGGD